MVLCLFLGLLLVCLVFFGDDVVDVDFGFFGFVLGDFGVVLLVVLL